MSESTLGDRILSLLAQQPGLTDREDHGPIAWPGIGTAGGQRTVQCALEERCKLERRKRPDGLTGNYLPGTSIRLPAPPKGPPHLASLPDPRQPRCLRTKSSGMLNPGCAGMAGRSKCSGVQNRASTSKPRRGSERWVIEAKGCGSLQPMRVNYFIGILGETLQRMDDPAAHYSIALPDLPQYRGLWQRLPRLAKTRTEISILFVGSDGKIAAPGVTPTMRFPEPRAGVGSNLLGGPGCVRVAGLNASQDAHVMDQQDYS